MFNIFHKHKLELVAVDNTHYAVYTDQNNKKFIKKFDFTNANVANVILQLI